VADQTVVPRGSAATAAEFLDAAAEDIVSPSNLPDRQLAATQAIGYALLAIADQLADLTDASTDLSGQLGDISDAVADIAESLERRRLAAGGLGHWPRALRRTPGRFKAALVALRTCGGAR
jgi:hypothetical protein